ncbi:MAG TPA: glycosyltransferase [Opitutaceae bacterium]|nr:glycosyltransferase [Opitutaceae bacterium]
MPLRILHSIRSVNPHGGGPVEGVKQMAAINRGRGHSIEVVSLDAADDPWVKAFPLPCHAMGPVKGSYGYSGKLVPWLRAHRSDYDAVIVDGLWQYNGLGVFRALRGTSTPYFVFTHGMLDPWFKRTYPLKHLKKWLYWPWGDYRVLKHARAVLFTCEEERRLARESFWLYKANERVVSFGTGAPTGNPTEQKKLFAEKFPETNGKECFLFLGRVHVKKGADLLFKAFAEILKNGATGLSGRPVHLIVAGPHEHDYGAEMKALAAALGIAERVTWTGMITGDLKWGAFYQSAAFVLPSHQENFGIAVAEAMACGVPVLISNKVNIWREIDADGAGLVENDDLPGTTKLLSRWLKLSVADRETMAARAVASFRNRFHVDQSAQSLIDAIEAR